LKEDNPAFAAQACNPKLTTEAIPGMVTFERFRLRFLSEQINLEIPLARLDIQKDEGSAEICFSTADQPDWIICTLDARVLQHPSLKTTAVHSGTDTVLRQRRRVQTQAGADALPGWRFRPPGSYCSGLTGIAVRVLLAKIPPQWEQQIGDDLMAELKTRESLVQDPKMLAKIVQATAPLINHFPRAGSSINFIFSRNRSPMPSLFPADMYW